MTQHTATTHVTREMQRCIDECLSCYRACLTMLPHSLEPGGKHADPAHVRLLLDCADICQTSAGFMLRGSEHHARTCGVCAEVCRACAEECERMAGDDALMRQCAEACRRCEESCREMAA